LRRSKQVLTKDLFSGYNLFMLNVSISDLKTNPASIILQSAEYPVAIQKRSKTQAYLVRIDIFEKLVAQLEDDVDQKAVKETDFGKGKNFEDLAAQLGI